MTEFTEGSQMRTNAGSPKTEKPNIIPKGQNPMTEPNKIYFSYRDVNGELQHALTTYEDAGPLLGDIMTQLCEYLAWLKNAPGGQND